jgi:thiol peroxidase
MSAKIVRFISSVFMLVVFGACALVNPPPEIPVSSESVAPATTVTRAGQAQKLLGRAVKVGDQLPGVLLTDRGMASYSLQELKGRTAVLSIAPSLDTNVCERQTHLLGEASAEELPEDIVRVKITRDLPFAHSRFAEQTDLWNILYLSDFKKAEFGLGTGLLLEELRLLARAIMVVDPGGTIRYLQVVPEVGHLPDMQKAFAVARQVAAE